jgi:hypothetical protein
MDEPSSQQRGYRVSLPFKTIAGVWYEAEPSTRDMSVRELRRMGPHHIKHRFPFRGGVAAIVAKYLQMKTALFAAMRARDQDYTPTAVLYH